MPYLPHALRLIWRAARPWTIAWAILLVLNGLVPVATVYLTRAVVDSLVLALDSGRAPGWDAFQQPMLWIGLMAGVMLLNKVLSGITTWVRTAQSELVGDHIQGLIHQQALALDLSFYETPAYYDILHRAHVDALNKPVALLENLGSLAQNAITLIAMGGVLLAYSVWLPLILFLSTIPAFWVVARATIRFHRWRVRNTVNERRVRYFDWMITLHRAAAEIRLFDLGDYFQGSFQNLRAKLRTDRLKLTQDQMVTELAAGGVALLVTGLALAWMVWRAVQGVFSLGDLALFYAAFNQGQRIMRTLLSNVGDIYRNIIFLENLFDFLALKPKIDDPAGGGSTAAETYSGDIPAGG
ncbi:MAG: ABC transporter transmembrane domain-containing protein [Chloroflexota bacterium]